MEKYNRAYRDPRSPLTPLTPRTSNTFNFEICSAKSPYTPKAAPFAGLVKSSKQLLQVPRKELTHQRHPSPKRFTKDFLKVREIFERRESMDGLPWDGILQQKKCDYAKPLCCKTENKLNTTQTTPKQQSFKQASPIAPRLLSPRVRSLLHKIKLDHLCGLFSQQEIDTDVFLMLTLEDLKSLGIMKQQELHQLLNAIKFAKEFF